MTYLAPRNKAGAWRRRGWLAGIVAVVFFVLVWQAPYFWSGLFTSMAAPFWRAGLAFENGDLRSPTSLLAENEMLKLKLANLELTLASSTTELLIQQNQDLLTLLGRATTTRSIYTAAAVLVRPPATPYDEMIIDLGQDDGVSTSTNVYAPGQVLIGQVAEVWRHTARVSLFSSPGRSFNVLVGPDRVPATAVGEGGGEYRAQVPHGTTLVPGDIVTEPALHDRAFGTVVSVNTNSANPFDDVLLAPPVNIDQLRFVLLNLQKK